MGAVFVPMREPPMKRRQRIWTVVLGILLILVAGLVYAAWPGHATYSVSAETTYVVDRPDNHGYVDYISAVNERLSAGITPENNANVLIWKALGPHPEGSTMPDEYFQWLGIAVPPEQGEYMVPWGAFLKERLKDRYSEQHAALDDRMFKAGKWPWSAQEEPELAEWLERNEKPLALIIAATKRPEYYNPLTPKRTEDWSPGLVGSLLPTVQKCREVSQALVCRALLRVREGKVTDAWQDLLACHRLGRLLSRGGCLIEALVGIAIEQIASIADIVFLDNVKPAAPQALAYLAELKQLPPMPALADKIDLTERFMTLETMLLVARYGLPYLDSLHKARFQPPQENNTSTKLFNPSVDWDPALRNANRWFDRIVTAQRLPERSARVRELAQISQDLKALKQQIATVGMIEKALSGPQERGEVAGSIVIALMVPAFERVQDAADRCVQQQRNVHTAFALAAYRSAHGRFPARLDELSPKYLANTPNDLFSDKPLIYKPNDKGYVLYSVGINGKDNEGRGPDDEPQGDDHAVRMPVPEPRKHR